MGVRTGSAVKTGLCEIVTSEGSISAFSSVVKRRGSLLLCNEGETIVSAKAIENKHHNQEGVFQVRCKERIMRCGFL